MLIGSSNLFEVGCRTFQPPIHYIHLIEVTGIESQSIGSNNTFEPRCRVPPNIKISDWCCIGAGCTVLPSSTTETEGEEVTETLPSRTVVYGSENARRMWSGEARLQGQALHLKHLDALREVSPERVMTLRQYTKKCVLFPLCAEHGSLPQTSTFILSIHNSLKDKIHPTLIVAFQTQGT